MLFGLYDATSTGNGFEQVILIAGSVVGMECPGFIADVKRAFLTPFLRHLNRYLAALPQISRGNPPTI